MENKMKNFDEKLQQLSKAALELEVAYRELPSDVKEVINFDVEEFTGDVFVAKSDIGKGLENYIVTNKSSYISVDMIKKARMMGSNNKFLNMMATLGDDTED